MIVTKKKSLSNYVTRLTELNWITTAKRWWHHDMTTQNDITISNYDIKRYGNWLNNVYSTVRYRRQAARLVAASNKVEYDESPGGITSHQQKKRQKKRHWWQGRAGYKRSKEAESWPSDEQHRCTDRPTRSDFCPRWGGFQRRAKFKGKMGCHV